MRGNLFTAAKVCLAGGCLSATALLLAPSPKGSSRFLASTHAAGRADIASVDAKVATAEPALAKSAKPIEPPLHRLASGDPDSAPLIGLAPSEFDDTPHAIDVAFTPVDEPVIERRVPEPTPDPVPQGSFALADELASLRQQVHRLSQAQTRPQQESGADVYGEMRQLIDRFTNAERFRTLEDEVRRLRKSEEPSPEKTAVDRDDAEPTAPSADPKPTPPLPSTGPLVRAVPSEFEPDRFTLQVEAADVTQVLDLLGQMAGWNVVAAPGVTGTVTLNLRDVTLDEALASVLAPQDFVAERKDNLLFVFPRTQADARAAALRVVATKVYRPNYINVADLQALATPLLTQTIGKIAVTSPSAVGLANDATQSGGDTLTQRDALVVMDYPEVLKQIDEIVLEMDVPPVQVVIEGYILRVQLRDNLRFGVNLALLGGDGRQLVTTGSGAVLGASTGFPGQRDDLVPPLPEFLRSAAGLRYGFLSGDVTGFIEALESIGETSLVASPSVRVLNKQKAELIIGKRLGYKTQTFNNQQTIENVQFLDVGTKLILRPFATPDGFVRMEIHPEQSSGSIDINGLPTVETTEVTSNVMVRDGSTVVIGGLIDEQTEEVVEQIPLLGSIPIIGNAFKTTDERLIRSELIVLITPRIVCDPIEEARGEILRTETEARAAYFTDRLSPVSRRNLARMHTERAADLYGKGRLVQAHDHTQHALSMRRNDGEALKLQSEIEKSIQSRRKSFFSWPPSFGTPQTHSFPAPDDPPVVSPPELGRATIPMDPLLVPPAPFPEDSFSPAPPVRP